jgi:hypothetical protein
MKLLSQLYRYLFQISGYYQRIEMGSFFRRGAFSKGSRVGGALRAPGRLGPACPWPKVGDKAGPPRSGGSRRPLLGDIPVSIPPGGCRSWRGSSLPRRAAAASESRSATWVAASGSARREQVWTAARGAASGNIWRG